MGILYFFIAAIMPFVFLFLALREYDPAHGHLRLIFYVLAAISFALSATYAIGVDSITIDIDNGQDYQRITTNGTLTETITNQHTDTIVFFDAADSTAEIYIYALFYAGISALLVVLAISESFMLIITAWSRKK